MGGDILPSSKPNVKQPKKSKFGKNNNSLDLGLLLYFHLEL